MGMIPAKLIDYILLGPFDDRRQLQDSPILGDVWTDFGAQPDKPLSLLIAPYRGQSAGAVARRINETLDEKRKPLARISCVHGFIAANLTFEEVLLHVVPLTFWWWSHFGPHPRAPLEPPVPVKDASELDRRLNFHVSRALSAIFEGAKAFHEKTGSGKMREVAAVPRLVALAGLILWAGEEVAKPNAPLAGKKQPGRAGPAAQTEVAASMDAQLTALLADPKQLAKDVEAKLKIFLELLPENEAKRRKRQPGGKDDLPDAEKLKYPVYSVSRNRKAMPALERSVPAVKADAAGSLFTVNCSEIGWAVLDSGIDAEHPAFNDAKGNSRVQRAFDFTRFRDYVSLSNTDAGQRKLRAAALMKSNKRLKEINVTQSQVEKLLHDLAESAQDGGSLRWDIVERLLEINPKLHEPELGHGTHVAGILGARKLSAAPTSGAGKGRAEEADAVGSANGMCPDINLYDFRVLPPEPEDTEFSIIAALQFIRYLNQRDTFMTIHGANLSLSIPHNVRNYACGQTPICEECNRLAENGVVVVAAAGNHGYKSFTTNDGAFDTYAAFSITDPGNAEDVITVGATHRFWPHTYGVSFFSSRGPTGDGRLKPDLVAPGEKIRAPLLNKQWGDQDGTSMAAPHVSGAAAMLMARYSEFRGRPRRIKQILCETATDLGRERSFQGHGMLDVLRAFQSI